MRRRAHTIHRSARLLRAIPLLASLAVLPRCSGGDSEAGGKPCETTLAGKCGAACETDTECPDGTHCGQEGKCTAVCGAGAMSCTAGYSCSTRGRCETGTLFGAGGGGTGIGSSGDAGACVVDTRRGEGLPAAIYIMNDQSQSMSCAIPTGGDRWGAMKSALSSFVQSPEASGLRVGIQYFGLGGGQGSCDPAVYEPADVEIGPLPGNANPVIQSLDRHGPSTYTPTPAAIEGAVTHARAWARQHPDHLVAVVLATDGQPNLCGNQRDRIGSVAQIAQQAYSGSPSIPVYVIGIVGGSAASGGPGCDLDPAPPNKPDLDRVAQAGGTGEAFIVDAATGDTSAQFLNALNRIRGAAVIPCQYVLPASANDQDLDPNKVNISFTPDGGSAQRLFQAPTPGDCDPMTGGWYYDDPSAPTKILLCPSICDQVKADARAQVDVLLGCKTDVIPPR